MADTTIAMEGSYWTALREAPSKVDAWAGTAPTAARMKGSFSTILVLGTLSFRIEARQ